MTDSTTPAASPVRLDRTRLVIAVVVVLVGLVWALQGLGVPIGGSFMVGDPTWTWIGGALIVVALAYAAWPRLRRS
jgi:cation transport ATPase